jgi:hypothetical protein
MLKTLVLMVLAFALGIYVANTYNVNLFKTINSTTQAVEKKVSS